jgi:hypothetical protein
VYASHLYLLFLLFLVVLVLLGLQLFISCHSAGSWVATLMSVCIWSLGGWSAHFLGLFCLFFCCVCVWLVILFGFTIECSTLSASCHILSKSYKYNAPRERYFRAIRPNS